MFTLSCTTCNARLGVQDEALIGQILACPKCGKSFNKPCWAEINDYKTSLFPGSKIINAHLDDDFSDKRVYALVVANKQDPTKWGLKNMSSDLWVLKKLNGETAAITANKIISIVPGIEIELPGAKKIKIGDTY